MKRLGQRSEGLSMLKRSKGSDGKALPGLWESDDVRMEWYDGRWEVEVPVRTIGKTRFYEFRALAMGGRWFKIGRARTRDIACRWAEHLKAGTHVYDPGYIDDLGPVPGSLMEWSAVAEEIARDPSVRGESTQAPAASPTATTEREALDAVAMAPAHAVGPALNAVRRSRML